MDTLIGFGDKKLIPAVIQDPFIKTKINSISVRYEDFWNDGKWKATGVINFKNGDTSGSQSFTGNTFDDVVIQIKDVLDNLK